MFIITISSCFCYFHLFQVALIEQNLAAQDNILKALTEAYARYAGTRKATNEILRKREATLSALISSYDAYEDLLAKSSKGLEFYRKLETNVSKLLQRVKGTCKVQDEEREQILAKNSKALPSSQRAPETDRPAAETPASSTGGPKLKDYLKGMKHGGTAGVGGYVTGYPNVSVGQASSPYCNAYNQVPAQAPSSQRSNYYDRSGPSSQLANESPSSQQWVPAIRPAPVGSEGTNEHTAAIKLEPSENKAPLPQQGYPYSVPTVSVDQSAGLKPVRGYMAMTYPDYSSAQYNYANAPAAYPVTQSPYIHQQQEQVPFTQGNVNTQGYVHGSTSHMQQYTPAGQHAVSSNVSENIVVAAHTAGSYSADAKSYINPIAVTQHSSPYTTEVSHQYQAVQPAYQQGGMAYPSGSNVSYSTVDQKAHDSGTYYMNPSFHQGYNVGAYPPVQQGHPSSSVHQTPTAVAVCSTPSQTYSGVPQRQLPSASSVPPGSIYDTTSGSFQYDGSSQNLQTGFQGQVNVQPHQAVWHQQPQALTYDMNSTSSNTAANVGSGMSPYYGSSAASLSSGSSSEVPLSNQQYYGTTQQQYQQFQHPYSYPAASSGYSLQQTGQVEPSVSAAPLSSEFQYMAATGASCYTNAGTYLTSQTCSSQTSVDGHTFASQYNTNQGVTSFETPVYSQASYYSLPYGYQYGADDTAGTLPESPQHAEQSSCTSNTAMNQTPQSPMTYMQARGQNDSTTTTFSQQGGNSVSSSSVQAVKCDGNENMPSSNVDLLAGLDFSLNQAPLVPQQPVTTAVWTKDEHQTRLETSDIKQTSSTPDDTNSSTPVVKTENADLPSEMSTSEPDTAVATLPQSNGLQAEKDGNQHVLVSNLTLSKDNASQEEGKLTPKVFGKDPYTDPDALNQFVQEVAKYEKFVDGLTTKTLNGPTPLDMKWKELLELQVRLPNSLYVLREEGAPAHLSFVCNFHL
jgi:tyrosine-protein phosphatase non-receptor type 23